MGRAKVNCCFWILAAKAAGRGSGGAFFGSQRGAPAHMLEAAAASGRRPGRAAAGDLRR